MDTPVPPDMIKALDDVVKGVRTLITFGGYIDLLYDNVPEGQAPPALQLWHVINADYVVLTNSPAFVEAQSQHSLATLCTKLVSYRRLLARIYTAATGAALPALHTDIKEAVYQQLGLPQTGVDRVRNANRSMLGLFANCYVYLMDRTAAIVAELQ